MYIEPRDAFHLPRTARTSNDWPPAALSRALDIVIAALALVFFAPLLVLIAAAIACTDPGPVFFRHRRVGLGGKTFGCWKFRTMVVGAEARLAEILVRDPEAAREWAESQKLTHDPRVTPLGNFLRRSSLDELPQLFNVLVGEMSIVGPRPIVETEAARYGQHFALYCLVRPGITGLWQISGRSDIHYFERVLLDVRYVSSRTVLRDMRIILLTVPSVLAARGSR
ncbi:MAG: sugar transferase [Erythrobacter sp.]|uniref:sugar transferase n=1 Tax=Erythrobacter sp. TaxID=1042 RepID=UPI0025CD0EA8|nr:sugar transferase [Erythrobacter sp.]MCL9999360.1 sugar transferase [Erythrobacter sp.]